MALTLGKSAKDSKYLKLIKDAIKGDSTHPRELGVKMQAHHLISAEGMKRSRLGKKIEKFGYDINLLPNLAFIPCTLQGACHLGVQPHRGNHTTLVEGEQDQDDYTDDGEPGDYHDMVASRVMDLDLPLSKECPGDDKTKSDKVIAELNGLSKIILKLIQKSPRKAPLTAIAEHFTPGKQTGCGGVDSVSTHSRGLHPCPVGRNHLRRQAPGQKNENIKFSSDGKFELKVGR